MPCHSQTGKPQKIFLKCLGKTRSVMDLHIFGFWIFCIDATFFFSCISCTNRWQVLSHNSCKIICAWNSISCCGIFPSSHGIGSASTSGVGAFGIWGFRDAQLALTLVLSRSLSPPAGIWSWSLFESRMRWGKVLVLFRGNWEEP